MAETALSRKTITITMMTTMRSSKSLSSLFFAPVVFVPVARVALGCLVFGFAAGFSSPARAADSPYYYGGTCGMKGSWTQQALERTNELKSFLTKIKDDPNCKTFPEALQKTFASLENEVKNTGDGEGESADLRREIKALRTLLVSDPSHQRQTVTLMTEKLIQQSIGRGGEQLELPLSYITRKEGEEIDLQKDARDLVSLKNRAKRAFSEGLRLVDQTVDILPQAQRCLVGDQQFGQFVAATVRLVGSFVASGKSPEGGLSGTISKLVNYMRETKFMQSIRLLEQKEFQASLSCLLEVTSENFCSTRDAQMLFHEMMAKTELTMGSDRDLRARNKKADSQAPGGFHPLEGYYIMTRNVPIISEWLLSVQLGIEPRLPSESAQKNKPLNELNNFYTTVNDLKAAYTSQVETIMVMKTEREKKSQIVKLVMNLSDNMIGNRGFNGADLQNFFLATLQPMHIPFRLLGLETPPEVMGKGASGFQQSPDLWLQANYENLPIFSTPDLLLRSIGENLDDLMRGALVTATTSFIKWFVVDKVAVIDRSIVGHLYNVRESLREIDGYLERLEDRVRRYADDKSMLLGLHDTRQRFHKVLAKFAELEALAGSLQNLDADGASSAIENMVNETITEVSNQFMVMLAKSSWLANRMTDFVHYDFNLMQRSGFDMKPFVQEIYLATGRAMVDQVVAMSGSSPAAVQQDLAQALDINRSNIQALESALGPTYADYIAVAKQIAEGYKRIDGVTTWITKHPEKYHFEMDEIPGNQNNLIWRSIKAAWHTAFANLGDVTGEYSKASEVFKWSWLVPTKPLPEDEFGSTRRVMNQLCIQVLAFSNLNPFWGLCRDAQLMSPFADAETDISLSSEDKQAVEKAKMALNVSFREKAWEKFKENRGLNQSLRICGLRDYNRKNLVLYLLQGTTRN